MFIADDAIDACMNAITDFVGEPFLWIPLLLFLLIASFTDVKSLKIPNWLTGSFFIVRLLLIPIVGIGWNHIFGAILLFFFVFVIAFILNVQMGGDIKAMLVIGLYLGYDISYPFILFTVLLLAVVGIVVYIITRNRKTDIPFAPILLVAVLGVMALSFV